MEKEKKNSTAKETISKLSITKQIMLNYLIKKYQVFISNLSKPSIFTVNSEKVSNPETQQQIAYMVCWTTWMTEGYLIFNESPGADSITINEGIDGLWNF